MLKTLAIAAGLTLAVSGAALAQSVYYTCSPGYAYSNGACQPVAATPGGVAAPAAPPAYYQPPPVYSDPHSGGSAGREYPYGGGGPKPD
jgi:hypothetical protein